MQQEVMGDRTMASTGNIREARRDMYRQQILSAAEFEFGRSGFEKTRMNDIARTANVSLATIYKYFVGKDQIWDELNRLRLKEFIEAAERATAESAAPLSQLLAASRALALYFAEHPDFLRVHVREGLSWATAGIELGRGQQRDAWATGISMMVELSEDVVRSGRVSVRRPAVLAGLVISSLQVWLSQWVAAGCQQPAAELADDVVDYLRKAITADSGH